MRKNNREENLAVSSSSLSFALPVVFDETCIACICLIMIIKAWVVLLTVRNIASYFTGRIAQDERIIFFPSSASQWNSTHWHVPIHGWIFQPKENSKKRAAFRSLLRRALKISSKSPEERILNHRIKSFVVDNERWKRPKIQLSKEEYTMAPSSKNGHFRTSLILPGDEIFNDPTLDSTSRTSTCVHFFALSSDGDQQYDGTIHLVPSEGITIISDIDDTIKITNVVNKREMLRNTFMREFEAVPGMAKLYQKWCSASAEGGPDVHLHLLSASLYQLYEELEGFREANGFPMATYSLKIVRPKQARQMIQLLLEDAMEYKRRSLTSIFETYPKRHFILVGDTGEKDPPVYASMAKDYPHQVIGIFLRHVAKGPEDNVAVRVQQTMNTYGIARDKWTVFEDPSTLLSVDLLQVWKDHTAA